MPKRSIAANSFSQVGVASMNAPPTATTGDDAGATATATSWATATPADMDATPLRAARAMPWAMARHGVRSRGARIARAGPALAWEMFATATGLVMLVLWVLTLGLKVFAFVDCARRPAAAFPAVGRQTKLLWLILTALAALEGLLPSLTLNIGMAATVVALVYLFVVRPPIVAITGRR
ncbi:MAG: DUF2516 family protein [Candidatus Nanopelagicales bacterium]